MKKFTEDGISLWLVDMQITGQKHMPPATILFNQMALEFTGNGRVIDFLKVYNLGFRDAMASSEHMPVWAEFSASEKVY